MAVIDGTKTFRVFHPWANERLYEGHIREAVLSYDPRSGAFHRTDLPEVRALCLVRACVRLCVCLCVCVVALEPRSFNGKRVTCGAQPSPPFHPMLSSLQTCHGVRLRQW